MSKQIETINIVTEQGGFFSHLTSFKIEDKEYAVENFLNLYKSSNEDYDQDDLDLVIEEGNFENEDGDIISLVESL